jgi:hypothetical protein
MLYKKKNSILVHVEYSKWLFVEYQGFQALVLMQSILELLEDYTFLSNMLHSLNCFSYKTYEIDC